MIKKPIPIDICLVDRTCIVEPCKPHLVEHHLSTKYMKIINDLPLKHQTLETVPPCLVTQTNRNTYTTELQTGLLAPGEH